MVELNKDGSNSILDNIKIASPCPVPWDTMEATEEERKRFCRQCSLHVYDLSGMSATEAEELIESSVGRLCVNFYQRPDGKVMTDDCPAALKALRNRYRKVAAFIAGILCSVPWLPLQAQTPPRLGGMICPVPKDVGDTSEYGKKNVKKLYGIACKQVDSPGTDLVRGSIRVTVDSAGKVSDAVVLTTTGSVAVDNKLIAAFKKASLDSFKKEPRGKKFLILNFDDPALKKQIDRKPPSQPSTPTQQ